MSKKISQLPDLRIASAGYLPVAAGGVTVRAPFGAQGGGVGTPAENTAAIQAAIDAVHAAYLAGAGVGEVRLPDNATIRLGRSTLAESYWDFGVPVPATDGCLVVRDGVTLRGGSMGGTVLRPDDPSFSAIYVVDGTNAALRDFSIDALWTGAGQGMGIIQLASVDDSLVAKVIENLIFENLFVYRVGSYGLGLQNASYLNCLVRNFRTVQTGADGIDIKNRPWPANDAKGITLDNIFIDTPGLRLDAQTGIDIRGLVHATNITVTGVGRAGVSMTGIRVRTASAAEGVGNRASVTGFYVRATSPATANTLGVDIGGADCAIVGGVIEDCAEGLTIGGNATETAERNTIVAVAAKNASVRAFYTYPVATDHNKFIGCTAFSSLLGFSNDAPHTTFVACEVEACTTNTATGVGAVDTEMIVGNQFTTDRLVLNSAVAGRASLEARGGSAVIDISIEPKGGGVVRFGDFAVHADAAITGYINIRSADGVVRKLAIIT